MGYLSNSTKDLTIFREQLRCAIASYVQSRTKKQIKYLQLREKVTQNTGSIQQSSPDSEKLNAYFGLREYQYLSRLIIATEHEVMPHDLRDKVMRIYQEMPKYFSFLFPIVDLSNKIDEVLVKFPRERLLEIELSEQKEQVQSCNTKIRHLTEEYHKSVKVCESLSQKIKAISSVENCEKVEINQQLQSAKSQCNEYDKVILEQQKNLLVLEQQNKNFAVENQTLTQQIEKLLKANQQLQESLQKLQTSYNNLRSNYESCPIKNKEDLEQFKQEILKEIYQRMPHSGAQEKNKSNIPQGPKLF